MPSNYDSYKPINPSKFMTLEQGENKIRIVSDFVQYGMHYPKGKKPMYCFGFKVCHECIELQPVKERILYWVIDRKDGQIKDLDVGNSIFKEIKRLRNSSEYGFDVIPPYDMIITMTGTGLDTEYTVMAARANTELDINEQDRVKALRPLSDLIEMKKQRTREEYGINDAEPMPAVGQPTAAAATPSGEEPKVPIDEIPF